MPGYPSACLVNFFYYLMPTVRKLMGLNRVLPITRKVALGGALKGRKGRWDIIRAGLRAEGEKEYAYGLDSQLTSHFLNFAECAGLVLLGNEVDEVLSGQEIDLLDFRLQF
jgi:molybdopterin molybdotransferase